MQIFKTYFRLVNRKKNVMLIYILVFIGLATAFTKMGKENDTIKKYTQQSVDIAVIDRDQSTLSKALKKYLGEHNKIVKIKDEEKAIKDELYWRNVEYILIIPKNFQEQVEQNKNVELISKKVEDAANATYVDEEVTSFMNLLQFYQKSDYSIEDAISHVREDLKQEASVSMVLKENGESAEKEANEGYYYFHYLPYVLIAIGILAVSSILIMFYQEDLRKRCICSSMELKKQNRQLILANTLFCMGITVVFIIIGVILTGGELVKQVNLWFYSINAIIFMLVIIALSFLLANLMNSETAINGCSNVFSLGFCFLGGIFVPLSIMPDAVVKAAHFVPSYWYVMANENVTYMTKVTPSFLKEFFTNVGVEFCFAVALLSVGLMVSKKKRVFS